MKAGSVESFWYTLAGHLGDTVDNLKTRMTAREFSRWMRYNEIEPIGPRRLDYLASMIAACVINSVSKKKVSVADVMPRWEGQREPPPPKTVEAKFRAFAFMHNAAVAKRGGR
jgi:hypothetical protein